MRVPCPGTARGYFPYAAQRYERGIRTFNQTVATHHEAPRMPIGAERARLTLAAQAQARAAGREVMAKPYPRRAELARGVAGEPVRLR